MRNEKGKRRMTGERGGMRRSEKREGGKEEDWVEGEGLDMTVLRTCAIQGI